MVGKEVGGRGPGIVFSELEPSCSLSVSLPLRFIGADIALLTVDPCFAWRREVIPAAEG
ncbi:MAG: hypothetical protein PHR28_02095 [candidate division Zixibacteria bacterium]|nr:hypothetical protein [candidate division Zixibacteria bacterium]